MRDFVLRWLSSHSDNKLFLAIASAFVGAVFTKLLPALYQGFQRFLAFIGKHLGGTLGYRYFERTYLSWLVTELRELKLTGVVSTDASKKPKLEQVFVSLRVGEERGKFSAVEATLAVVEDMSRRNKIDYGLIAALRQEFALAPADQRSEAERILGRFLVRRNRMKRFYRRLTRKEPQTESLVAEEILAEVEQRPESRSPSDYAAVLLKKILRDDNRIAILGAPGAGKTTLLQYIGLAYARARAGDSKLRERKSHAKRLGAATWRLPIFVRLSSIATLMNTRQADGRETSLIDALTSTLPPDLQVASARSYFEKQLKKGRCVLLLDGLDEVPGDAEFKAVVRAVESLAAFRSKNQFVISSRIAGWRTGVSGDFRQYYVNEFSDAQVSSFIDTWYAAVERNTVVGRLADEGETEKRNRQRKAQKKAQDLKIVIKENGGLRQLATNPMLLSIIALVHHSLATLPQERTKLYQECTKILLEQWDIARGLRLDDTNLKLEQKDAIMRRIAFAMHSGEIGDPQSTGENEVLGVREARREDVERILATVLPEFGHNCADSAHLLQILIERSGVIVERQRDVVAFAHLTFQEYFTAKHLAKAERQETRNLLLDKRRTLSNWWREVILLYSGLLNDSSTFIHGIQASEDDDLLWSRLRLAAWCLGEAVQVKQTAVRDSLVSSLIRIRSKGAITSTTLPLPSEVTSYLIRWSKEEDWYSHALQYSMTRHVEDPSVVIELISEMLSSSQVPMQLAALAAVTNGPVELLQEKFCVPIATLGRSSSPEVVSAAMSALARTVPVFGEHHATAAISAALSSRNRSTRNSAILLVRQFHTEELIRSVSSIVLRLQSSSDWRDREISASVFELCALYSEPSIDSIDSFFRLLYDSDSDVTRAATESLTLILSSNPRATFVERTVALLKNERPAVRQSAAKCLGKLRKSEVIEYRVFPALLNITSDKNKEVRAAVLQSFLAFAESGMSSELLQVSLDWIDGARGHTRACLLRVLAAIHPHSVPPQLSQSIIRDLFSGNAEVRAAAATAVGALSLKSDRPTVVNDLLNLSTDRKPAVRSAAVKSIATLCRDSREEKILDAIKRTISDKQLQVRTEAVRAVQLFPKSSTTFLEPVLSEIKKTPKSVPTVARVLYSRPAGVRIFRTARFLDDVIWSDGEIRAEFFQATKEALEFIGKGPERREIVGQLLAFVDSPNVHPAAVSCAIEVLSALCTTEAEAQKALEAWLRLVASLTEPHTIFGSDLTFELEFMVSRIHLLYAAPPFSWPGKFGPQFAALANAAPQSAAVKAIRAALDSGESAIRGVVLGSVTSLKSSIRVELIPSILKRMTDEDVNVRSSAWRAYVEIARSRGHWTGRENESMSGL